MPRSLAVRLRSGLTLDDDDFDGLYPVWGRSLSRQHWTPVAVARRAAQWLVAHPGARVLDVGSGLGKFAIIGSLVTDGVFCGVEQRERFVEAARAAARGLGARTVQFVHANMTALDWHRFDAFYLYNPFLDDLRSFGAIDETSHDRVDAHASYVEHVRQELLRARPGTRVATYHGFGGELPPCYQRQAQATPIRDLELWLRCAD